MNLQDYYSDARILLDKFKPRQKHDNRKQFLDTYLRTKNFSQDELNLLLQVITEEFDKILLQRQIDYEKGKLLDPPDDEALLRELDVDGDESELYFLVHDQIEKPLYPFDKIALRFLTSIDNQKKFEEAELFMIQQNYLNKDGSWIEDARPVGILITFLNLLKSAKILRYTSEKDMREYFSNRYKIDLGSQMKLNKFDSFRGFRDFYFLGVRIGADVEKLLSNS